MKDSIFAKARKTLDSPTWLFVVLSILAVFPGYIGFAYIYGLLGGMGWVGLGIIPLGIIVTFMLVLTGIWSALKYTQIANSAVKFTFFAIIIFYIIALLLA